MGEREGERVRSGRESEEERGVGEREEWEREREGERGVADLDR